LETNQKILRINGDPNQCQKKGKELAEEGLPVKE